ncbi:MAG: hypothetical protein ACKVP0_14155 [Pirellulaceae bacterium]
MPRFTIREVMMAFLVIGMGLGWWVNRRQWKNAEEYARSESERLEEAAGTLERILKLEGYAVEWGDWHEVRVTTPDNRVRQLKTWTYITSKPVYHVTD